MGNTKEAVDTSQPEHRFKILTEAATILGKNVGNLHRSKSILKSELPIYVKVGDTYFPVAGKTILLVDMWQFNEEEDATNEG